MASVLALLLMLLVLLLLLLLLLLLMLLVDVVIERSARQGTEQESTKSWEVVMVCLRASGYRPHKR